MSRAKQFKYVMIGLNETQAGQLKELSEFMGMSASNVLRVALLNQFKDQQKERFGYRGFEAVPQRLDQKQKKEEKNEVEQNTIEYLKSMNDVDLTIYLHDIGYINSTEMVDTKVRKEWDIYTDEVNRRFLREQHVSIETGAVSWKRLALNWDEMIKDLKKENKLIPKT